MPAWGVEGGLTLHQIDALTALVGTWLQETLETPAEEIPDTVAAGAQVYIDQVCGSCHGPDYAGVEGVFPSLLNIGNEPVIDLPTPISQLDKLQDDYAAGARAFLELWIRDSATNYNDGTATGMPVHPEGTLNESALRALITFLLSLKQ
jgi:cytochrome c2